MLKRKVGDEWRQSTKAWVKVNGTWKEIKSLYKKEAGTWTKVSGITTVNQTYQQYFTSPGTPIQQPVTFTQPFQTPNPPAQQPVPAQQPFFFSQPFSTQQPYTVRDPGLYIQHLWFAQPSPGTNPFPYQQVNPIQQPSSTSTTPGGVECADGPVGPSPGSYVPFASTPNPSNQLSSENNGICFPLVSFTQTFNQVPRPIQSPSFVNTTVYSQQPVTYAQPSPPYQAAPFTNIQQPKTCPRQTPVKCSYQQNQPNSVTSSPGGTPFPGGQCVPQINQTTSPSTYQDDGTPKTCSPAQQPQPPAQQPQPPNPRPAKQGGPQPRPPAQVPRPPAQVATPPAQVARPPAQVARPPAQQPVNCPYQTPIQCPYQQPKNCPYQTPIQCSYQVPVQTFVTSSPGGTPYPGGQCVPFADTVTSPINYQQNGTPVTCTPTPIQQGTNYTTVQATTTDGGTSCPNVVTTPTGQPIRRTSGSTPGGPFTPGICYPNLIPSPAQVETFTATFTDVGGVPCNGPNAIGPPGPYGPNANPRPAGPWNPTTKPNGQPGALCNPIIQPVQQPVQTSRTVTQWNPTTTSTPVTVTPGNMPTGLPAPTAVISANPANCGPTSPVGAGRCGVQPFDQWIIAKTSQSTVGSGGLPAPASGPSVIQTHRAPDGLVYSRYRQTGPINPGSPTPQAHPGPGQPIFNWNPDPYTPPTAQVPFPITFGVPGGFSSNPIPGPPGTVVPSTFVSGGEYQASYREYQTSPGGVRCFKIDPSFDFGDNSSFVDVNIRGAGSNPTGSPISYSNVTPNPNGPSNVGICYPLSSSGTNQVESFTSVQTTPGGVQCGPSAQNTQCFPVQQPVAPFSGTNQATTTPSGVSCPPGSVTPAGQPVPRSAPGLCYPFDLGTVVSGCASTTRLRNIWR